MTSIMDRGNSGEVKKLRLTWARTQRVQHEKSTKATEVPARLPSFSCGHQQKGERASVDAFPSADLMAVVGCDHVQVSSFDTCMK